MIWDLCVARWYIKTTGNTVGARLKINIASSHTNIPFSPLKCKVLVSNFDVLQTLQCFNILSILVVRSKEIFGGVNCFT
jgi:hypothetical protein